MPANTLSEIRGRLQSHEPHVLGSEEYFKSAVLLPLVERDGQLHVLFEVRAKSLRRQPGEICFPGGKVDACDGSELDAAVRETCEELGVPRGAITPIAPLDFLVTPFNSIIYPFVGTIDAPGRIRPNPDEVAEVFYVPLAYFSTVKPERHDIKLVVQPPEDFPFHLIAKGKYYNWRTGHVPEYFYTYQGRVIWGLTARILHHFLALIGGEHG
ncbi:CoA pyrophosphatase [Bacillaceae bacterium]